MTSITQQRVLESAQGLVVVRREQWGSAYPYTSIRAVTEPAIRTFFHITVTNPDAYGSENLHMRAIESIGQGRFGSGISYNMVVMPSGRIFEGQPVGRRGTHTGSYTGTCASSGCPNRGKSVTSTNHNVTARAVVIAQNVGDPVSSAQIHSIAKVAAAWKRSGAIVSRSAPWHGHRCVSTKSCPGDKAWAWMAELSRLTELYTVNGLGGEDDDMTTPAETEQALRNVLGEQRITLDWNGQKVSFYEALSFIHFNGADGSFVGTIPATSVRTGDRGRATFAKYVKDALAAVQTAVDEAGAEIGLTPEQVEALAVSIASKLTLPEATVNLDITVDGVPV
jgi:hypothetical protein